EAFMDMYPPGRGPLRPAVPLWQRAWLDPYPCDVPSSIPYPSMPVSGLLESAARRFPERTACTVYGRGQTYQEMSDQAHRLAGALADLGARPGRCVAMLMP